jgi:starch synthase
MKSIRVLSVASEIFPLMKTGGLADVVGAFPIALKAEDIDTCTLVPGYPAKASGTILARKLKHHACHKGTDR